MTLIYLHHDQNSGSFEVFSDSVISNGNQRITDIFPKINVLNIRSRRPDDGGIIQDTQLGFAFSGSTLSAQAVFTSASAFLQNLASTNNALLSIDDACSLISKIARHQVQTRGAMGQNPQDIFVNMVLTGFCPVLNRVTAYKISSEIIDNRFGIRLEEIPFYHAQGVTQRNVFGSGSTEFIDYAANHPELGAFELFSAFINECDRNDVGGHVQYGLSHAQGFEICPVVATAQRADGGDPVLYRQLAGIGLDTDNLISNPRNEEDKIIVGRLFRGTLHG
ncbi:hypothetical protein [Kordiimonas aquimaris]|uniref:hypothetical protein n=1 Tax=Kordiimonas aquimaris TaxID=707591 RepID=UPI0021D0D2D1|nr:hypothetical protein [Kordiimonas aquimaris]